MESGKTVVHIKRRIRCHWRRRPTEFIQCAPLELSMFRSNHLTPCASSRFRPATTFATIFFLSYRWTSPIVDNRLCFYVKNYYSDYIFLEEELNPPLNLYSYSVSVSFIFKYYVKFTLPIIEPEFLSLLAKSQVPMWCHVNTFILSKY